MTSPSGPPQRVAVLVFDQMDLLDVGGPIEVLLTANRLLRRAGRPAASPERPLDQRAGRGAVGSPPA